MGVDTAMHTTTWPKIIKIQLSHAKILIAIGGIAKKKKKERRFFIQARQHKKEK